MSSDRPRLEDIEVPASASTDDVPYVDADGYLKLAPPAGGAPSGAAGGDLAGTYPNPTIGSAGMEAIRDMLASVITAGTDITVTVSDAGDTITIDSTASGGGGGSSIVTIDTPPTSPDAWDYEFDATSTSLPSGWAWVNQGTAAYNEASGVGAISAPSNGATVNLRVLEKAIPSGTTWEVLGKFTVMGATGTLNAGICVRNSSNGKLVTFGHRASGTTVRALHYTSATVFNAVITGDVTVVAGHTFYLKLRKNSATSYDMLVSRDGVYFWTLVSANNIEATSGTLDKLGFFVAPENSSPAGISCHFLRKVA